MAGLDDLSQRFRRFALNHARPTSPLYSHLALGVAGDRAILGIAQKAASTPATNLFFATVHNLLLSGADHPLRAFYPNLTPDAQPPEGAFPLLRSFCGMYEPELVEALKQRRTQTNEVRRCQYLALGFDLVAREAGRYSVIDVGSSAGLHLMWPRYGYDYEGHRLGDAASPVQLTCQFEGELRPSLPREWSEPVRQIGIDLNPLDPTNHADQTWLRALIWPEHAERAALLDHALRMACAQPPRVETGDVFARLPELLDECAADGAWCVCHNHTLNQFSDADRRRFDEMLAAHAVGRPIYRLSAEWLGTEKTEFVFSKYLDGAKSQRLLARVDDHGAWVQWADRVS